ncbi:hypothetical protein HK102_004354, partial [Quaeritorhiza haematococci]
KIVYIQSTVGAAHPIIYPKLRNIYTTIESKTDTTGRQIFQSYRHALLFMVPPDIYGNFKYQGYKNQGGKTDRKPAIDIPVRQYVGKVLEQNTGE